MDNSINNFWANVYLENHSSVHFDELAIYIIF